ncbi:transmembrane protein 182-like [Protopterus annectens]|uniref:transmembrane protein 182-like n=1 Tax=Protopterus annectens TaxID=7888 RepID=UPI001CF950A6|nr:transmembrane protein 182-like [Protopterus annectens]
MKVGIAAFVAGFVGAAGVLLFFIAFGTDYWLLATENCKTIIAIADKQSQVGVIKEGEPVRAHDKNAITFHHEGFFWRCWFIEDASKDSIWSFWFTSQPRSKSCNHGYLFPMPIAIAPVPHPSYDGTAVYRGFWTAFIIVAIAASVLGGFLLVCAVPFVSASLYKAGGACLITAGVLFSLLISLFVIWKELAADLTKYILLERSEGCVDTVPYVQYGWSFMFAASGIPLTLLSGILFYVIGRSIQGSQNK